MKEPAPAGKQSPALSGQPLLDQPPRDRNARRQHRPFAVVPRAAPFAAQACLVYLPLLWYGQAVMGAAADNQYVGVQVHHLVALAMIAINVLTAIAEYGAIRSNASLIDRILELIGPDAPAQGAA